MAFRLNAQLGKSYNSAFANAEAIASKTFGKIAKLGAAVLGGMGVSDVVDTYKDFQQSMANTGAIAGVDKTSSEFKALEEAALEAGRTTTKTAEEASDALGYMKLAGWSTKDSINSLIPVLRLSEATGADLATTSDLVTDSMSAMGLKSEELSTYLDMAAKANNAANHSALELMEGIIGSGGAARAAGVNMYDLSTALGILADNGTKGSEAGTAMNAMLVRMTTHSKAAEAFEELGVNVFDTAGNFRGLEDILVDLNSAMKGMSTEDVDFYLKNIAGTQYFSKFKYLLDSVKKGSANTSEFTNRWKELNSQMHNSAGSLDKMAEAMNDTLSSALSILGSASDDMKIQIMKEIEPTLTPIIRKISDILPSVGSKVASFVKDVVSKGKDLWKNLKPVFSFLAEHFDDIKIGIMAVAGAFTAAKIARKILDITSAVKTFFSAVRAHPIMLLVEAVTALGFALYEAHRQAKEANLEEHFGNISISVEEAGRIAEDIVNKKSFEKLISAMNIQDKLKEQESSLQGYISELEKIHTLIEFNIELTPDDKESYKENVKNYVNGVLKYIQDEWQSQKLLFSDNQFMLNIINTDMSGTYESVKGIGEELIKMVNDGISEGNLDQLKEKVAEAIEIMEEYKREVAINTAVEKNKIAVSEFMSGELNQESAQSVIEQINSNEREIQEKSVEAAAAKKTSINQAYNRRLNTDKPMTEKERDTQLALADKQISMARADSLIRAQETLLGGADEKFGGFINKRMEQVDAAYGEMAKFYREEAQKDGMVDPSIFLKKNSKAEEVFQNLVATTNYSGKEALEAESLNEYMGWIGDSFEISNELMESLPKDSEQYQKLKALKKKYDLYSEGTRNESSFLPATAKSVVNSNLFHDKMTELDAVPTTVTLIPEITEAHKAVSEANKIIKKELEKTSVETKVQVKPVPGMEQAYNSVLEATKTIKQNFEGSSVEAEVPTNVKSVMNDVLAAAFIAANRATIKNDTEQPMSAGVPTNAESVMNMALALSSVAANRATIKSDTEQPMNAEVPTNATVKPGVIDTSIFEGALTDSIVTGIANGVGKAAAEAKQLIKISPSGGNVTVEKNAKGTEYSADTFIAGENGAELITGARGRKVFTALETGNIFNNIGKIKDTLVSAVGAVNIFERLKRYNIEDDINENRGMKPERVVKSIRGINNNSNISVTVHNEINVDGGDTKDSDNLKNLIDKVLRESTGGIIEAVKEAVMEAIEKENERKVRLQNG